MSNPASNSTSDFFDQKIADSYDERNSRLAPISDGLHFLLRLTLASLPACYPWALARGRIFSRSPANVPT